MLSSLSLLLALVEVACVSVFHTALAPIIPNARPLNCGFCLSLWVAMGVAAKLWSVDSLAAIPLAGFLATIVTIQWPWAFYTTTGVSGDSQ